ncbi:MAG: membrane protein insertion efficiency factor YidD [Candidatus Omnitrophota bacterium]
MLQRLGIQLVNVYQRYIRFLFPCACRFSPSCSEYSKQAMSKYGFFRGAGKGVKRLLRCHPFSGSSGYDPLE